MRLIDANALRTIQSINKANFNSIETIQKWIDEQPTIEERKTGKWIRHITGYSDHYECTACGKAIVLTAKWNFCPYCGARMVKEGEDNE